MEDKEIKDICEDRLWSWKNKLINEHSTPLVLVGVGHDHKSGQLIVCTTEEMSDNDIKLFLQGAIEKLKQ